MDEDVKLLYGTEEDLKDFMDDNSEFDNDLELEEMFNTSLSGVEEGKIVKGKILKITDKDVYVDINFKSEGVVPLSEFRNSEDVEVGREIEIYLEEMENKEGQIVLSKLRADFMKVWEMIKNAHESGDIVKGRVVRKIKGGVVADLFGIDAFLPGSQIDLRQIPDLDSLIGQELDLKVIKINKLRRNIVVSRRVVLEEERSKMREKIIQDIEVGQVWEGIVKNITDFGAFIDLGGVDGLLHITDMSWGRVNHPSEIVGLGDKIKVKILGFDDRKTRISLGMKQLEEHPWKDIEEKYPEGSKVKGKIVNITDYGAFMELEKGIEGLIHISEMSWTQHIKHPSKFVDVGDTVEAVVLKVDKEDQKISLGLKQTTPDPWENVDTEFPEGSTVSGQVRNIAAFGVFVELKPGIEGLIHISDMSWTRKITHPSEMFNKGDTVEVKVLSINKPKRRISLGLKQMEENPWDSLGDSFAEGTDTKGKVVRLLDRGAVVDLPGGVEGFVPVAKLGSEDVQKPEDVVSVGDELPLKVLEFDKENQKITVSVEDYFKGRDEAELKNFLEKHKPKPTTLGDVMEDAEERKEDSASETVEESKEEEGQKEE
ncbi:MAG: 30S ribosomal protein S1 [Fibrobacterota bacterium]